MNVNLGLAVFSLGAVLGVYAGCGSEGGIGAGGNGGNGGGGGEAELAPIIEAAHIVDNAEDVLDAAPNPEGTIIYFVGRGAEGVGLYQVAVDGGEPASVLVGDPFVDPRGVVVSHDREMLYVADPKVDGGGALIAVALSDFTAEILEPTLGLAPTAVEIRELGDQDEILFAGTTTRGAPAVFSLEEGGATARIEQSRGLVAPDGLAIANDGTLFVADSRGDEGVVLRFDGSGSNVVDAQLRLGSPAGLALLTDGQAALASSMNPSTATSQVAITFLGTGKHAVFDDVIGANQASGGLHRAYLHNVYAWAGRTAGVYRVIISPAVDSSSIGGPGDRVGN